MNFILIGYLPGPGPVSMTGLTLIVFFMEYMNKFIFRSFFELPRPRRAEVFWCRRFRRMGLLWIWYSTLEPCLVLWICLGLLLLGSWRPNSFPTCQPSLPLKQSSFSSMYVRCVRSYTALSTFAYSLWVYSGFLKVHPRPNSSSGIVNFPSSYSSVNSIGVSSFFVVIVLLHLGPL